VPWWHSVQDGRTARDETFETGDPTTGVDEHVGRRDQIAHPVGEAEDADARLPVEGHAQALPRLLVSTRHARYGGRPRSQRGANGAVEVSDAPTPAGDEDDRAAGREVERAPGLDLAARLEERRGDERTHAGRAAGPRQLRDSLARAVVHDEVEIDPGVGPELEAREIEHRGADRDADAPVSAQAPEDRVDARVGRDDDVGPVRLDQSTQALAADPVHDRLGGSSHRREAHEQRVDDPEDPRHTTKLKPRAVANEPAKQGPERGEPVPDRYLRPRALAGQVRGKRPGGRVVSFAEVGGENEDPARRRRRGLDAGPPLGMWCNASTSPGNPPPARDPHARNLSFPPDGRCHAVGRQLSEGSVGIRAASA